jgi:hypothetical protein
MLSYRGDAFVTHGNKILSSSAGMYLELLTGSAVADASDELLKDSSNSFAKQHIIGTAEMFSETQGFEFSHEKSQLNKEVIFRITDTVPFKSGDITKASIDAVESLFADSRLAHLPNFRYLPPVNKSAIGLETGAPLGDYEKLNQNPKQTFQDLMTSLRHKPRSVIRFDETSNENNLIAQIVEAGSDHMEKLSVIDFGEFPDEEPLLPGKRVFFAGKIFTDNKGSHTFVNIFTLIFH